MTNIDEKIKLKRSLYNVYRNTSVSPFLSSCVIANVNNRKRNLSSGLKLACAVFTSMCIVMLITFERKTEYQEPQLRETSLVISLRLPTVVMPAYSSTSLGVPGLSSLSSVPSLNHFHTPATSLDSAGDFCVYLNIGEKIC